MFPNPFIGCKFAICILSFVKNLSILLTTKIFVFQKVLFYTCEISIFLLHEIRTAYLRELVQLKVINKAQPSTSEARMQWSDKPELPGFI